MSTLGLDVPQLGMFTQSTLGLTSCQYVWAYVDCYENGAVSGAGPRRGDLREM
jgi:hypothetical protein